MNHRRTALITTVILTAASLGAASGNAHADERVCRGSLGAITVDNLRVPDRATCTLNGTLVKGTIKVESGATLTATSVRVIGNIQAENHRKVTVNSSRVGGSIQIVQGGASGIQSTKLTANQVNGDVQLFENVGSQAVSKNRIGGNLQCKENRPAPTGSANVVGGNKEDQCRRL